MLSCLVLTILESGTATVGVELMQLLKSSGRALLTATVSWLWWTIKENVINMWMVNLSTVSVEEHTVTIIILTLLRELKGH